MMSDEARKMDERVRLRAYELWDKEGRPHGRNEEYWMAALRQIQAEEREHPTDAPLVASTSGVP